MNYDAKKYLVPYNSMHPIMWRGDGNHQVTSISLTHAMKGNFQT